MSRVMKACSTLLRHARWRLYHRRERSVSYEKRVDLKCTPFDHECASGWFLFCVSFQAPSPLVAVIVRPLRTARSPRRVPFPVCVCARCSLYAAQCARVETRNFKMHINSLRQHRPVRCATQASMTPPALRDELGECTRAASCTCYRFLYVHTCLSLSRSLFYSTEKKTWSDSSNNRPQDSEKYFVEGANFVFIVLVLLR